MADPVARARVTHDGSVATITLHGEIDVSSADVLADAVAEARTAGSTELVIDLGAVSFIDLSGLRVLHLAATDGVPVVLRQPSRLVRRVVDLAGMAGVLGVEEDEVRGSGRD